MNKRRYLFLYGSERQANDAFNMFALFQNYSYEVQRKVTTDNSEFYFGINEDKYRYAGMCFTDIVRFTHIPQEDWAYYLTLIREPKE